MNFIYIYILYYINIYKIQEYLQNIYKSRNNLLINYVHLNSFLELTINY